ncbi:MAG: response regulator transcription factor [Lachnospiraceae bacterium]|nr:response regulator transcription factor [Lachnospiraceae bacterium]
MAQILLLEDDESINRGIAFQLEKEGYDVTACRTVAEAETAFHRKNFQLMICDVGLPDGNGLDFVKKIREESSLHIIFLTALDQEIDQVMGYEAGGDDYVTKPFSLSVLMLKVSAYFKKQQGTEQERLESGNICFYVKEMRVLAFGKEISLTKNEWKMLRIFMEHPRQILSKKQLLEQLFDAEGDFVDENTIAVNIRRLREKIEPDISRPEYIKNVRGMGYLWDKECRNA